MVSFIWLCVEKQLYLGKSGKQQGLDCTAYDFAPKFDVFAPKISRLILFEFASSVFMNSRLSRVYF